MLPAFLFSEHALLLAGTFFLPPVAFVVFLCVVLASLGKSLGLRMLYVNCLIAIFEWGARQIKTTVKLKRKESSVAAASLPMFDISSSSSDEEDHQDFNDDIDDDGSEGRAPRSDGYESSSGLSITRRRHNSTNSTCSHTSSCSLRRRHGSGNNIIVRDTQLPIEDDDDLDGGEKVQVSNRGWAAIFDSVDFIKNGIESIIEDEVTSRFEAEQLMTWNMLTRTSTKFFQFVNWKLTLLYMVGFIFRYTMMLPLRLTLFCIGLIFMLVSTAVVGLLPDGRFKRYWNEKAMLTCHRILSRSISALVYFHDEEYKARGGGIAVANHTSPMDVMILSTDNVYALIGQRHGGLLGLMQRALSRASAHIWFERSEAGDRSAVTNMLQEHVNDKEKLPILIFPEGTCINNTSVMMFKKGSFEVGTTIYPIAMKYDSRFGDPFWNSSEQSWAEYLLRMMTSWAIICHVYYLPPMTRLPGEDAVEFANRVKKAIAARGGLVDLYWDGGLKRSKVPPRMIAKQQEKYFNRLQRYTSTSEPMKLKTLKVEDDDAPPSSPISGYNSLEELPEDAVATTDEEPEVIDVSRPARRTRRSTSRPDPTVSVIQSS